MRLDLAKIAREKDDLIEQLRADVAARDTTIRELRAQHSLNQSQVSSTIVLCFLKILTK